MTSWEHSHSPRILIIDDNPSIHRDFDLVFADELQNADLEADEQRIYGQPAGLGSAKPAYRLNHALSGLEGIEKVRQALAEEHPYQLAFVDIRMPGIDGVETIERVWQLDARLQVVICTAYADYSWGDLERRLGPTDKLLVLKKPFDNIEVTQLASTLTAKWLLAQQAALKLEQMELLVAQRTQKLLALQRGQRPEEGEPLLPDLEVALPAAAEAQTTAKEPPLILVVTDQRESGRAISQGLGPDYRFIEVRDGEQGLHQAQETVPDAVIAEVLLPHLDGLGLCRQLKAEELASHIPVILLASHGLEEAQLKALEAGADDFITRPWNLPILKARLENLLRARRRVHEPLGRELTLQPRDLATNQVDAQFLRRTLDTIEQHLSDCEFDVDALAHHLAMSRRQLFRKLKGVTGGTPNALIRTARLNRAAQLLQTSQMTVTEITYAVGFSDLKHFRSVFREQFGVLPGDYTKGPGGGAWPPAAATGAAFGTIPP